MHSFNLSPNLKEKTILALLKGNFERGDKVKKKFVENFKEKRPNKELGKLPPDNFVNRYSHITEISDTCDDTSLASEISEDSIAFSPQGHHQCFDSFNSFIENTDEKQNTGNNGIFLP